MAKFNLLTTMTLNAAGFTGGIDSARRSTQALEKGTKSATSAIASSFSGLTDKIGGMDTPLNGVKDAVMGGVGAFRMMIPAIGGVSTALIASGIGAIVVGIGLAFAALTSYFTGTTEGANKLNKMMGYLKGTFNAILHRVNLLGASLVKLFDGDFKGAADDLKGAFDKGLGDEITNSAKEHMQFAEEENRLFTERLNLQKLESKGNAEKSEYLKDAANKNLSAAERAKELAKFEEKAAEVQKRKLKYLNDEWQLVVKKNAASDSSREDLEAEASAYATYQDAVTAFNNEQRTVNRLTYQITNANTKATKENTVSIEDSIKTLKSLRDEMYLQGKDTTHITAKIKEQTDAIKARDEAYKNSETGITGIKPLDIKIPKMPDMSLRPTPLSDKYIIDTQESLQRYNDMLSNMMGTIKNTLMDFGNVLGEGIANLFKKEDEADTTTFGQKILGVFGGFLTTMGNAILSFGIAMTAFQKALENIFSGIGAIGAIAAGVGLIAAGGIVKNLAEKGVKKYANGGIVGGNNFVGDNNIARVNSGEMILNRGQQANLFAMANNGGMGGGQVTFKIQGDTLVGVLSNYNRRIKSYN